MKGPKFILDRLKEDFGVSKKDEQNGFPDMNYVVGNTSGLDVGNIPTPVDRRIGSQAQIGGSAMEVQIYNPSTFSVEGDQIIDVVDQLGLDITLHSDPNMGFASAYKTRGQQGVGIETVHPYFTNYLEAMAKFKQKAQRKADFNIGRINPHASTSPMPALEERMPMDVGMDPFGYSMSELEQSPRRNSRKNIFQNQEFMKKFYKTFILNEVDEPYQIYQLFSRFSKEFRDNYWRKAQAEATNRFWNNLENHRTVKDDNDRIEEKIAMLQSARMQDQGIEKEWLEIIDSEVAEFDEPIETPAAIDVPDIKTIGDLPFRGFESLAQLIQARYRVKNLEVGDENLPENLIREIKEKLDQPLEKAIDKLWKGDGNGSGELLMSAESKTAALTSRLDIQQTQILELAQGLDDYSQKLENAALSVVSGESNFNFFEGEMAEEKKPADKHRDLIQNLMNSFEQPMWMESNIFYYIIPCWMSSSSVESENHSGWDAPEFIWKALVVDEWSDEYDINLENPEIDGGYFDALEESHEFRMDVCAAVAACYIWGHFTQMESEFESGDRTWMEFMNANGIGVNLEAMHGNPQQLLKLWRPKDIAVAAHAINITAREELGEVHPELDGCIAKFTIDMEHVASFGANPWKQMKDMIENEEKIASYKDYNTGIDPEKPLAKILRQYHLMKPGVESQQGTYHGPFRRGDKQLYTWLYRLVEDGFARNQVEQAAIMYEQGEEKDETIYTTRIAMNMIELGIEPDEVTPDNVDPGKDKYEDEREALIARFFGMDKANYSKEWAKIEEHAFDPLEGLLEAEQFDYTYSSVASLEADNNPRDYAGEEYK
jgi:hypothetical protein